MEILWLKIAALVIIFLSGLFAGIMPLRIALSSTGRRQMMWGNAFAGGVFLGAGLLHMLPDAQENFQTFAQNISFPFPILIAGVGFLFILMLEKTTLTTFATTKNIPLKRNIYPFLLCFILSIHSIIAGMALGLETTLLSASAIFIAIIAHKGAAAFALGVTLKENGFSTKGHLFTIAFFSLMTPLGVILGTLFSQTMSGSNHAGLEALFDSLAAGTFLYIAIVDIIDDVFKQQSDSWRKVFLIITGFALMALIAVWL